jgi:hypothetical protein
MPPKTAPRPFKDTDINLLSAWVRSSSDCRVLMQIHDELKTRDTPKTLTMAKVLLLRANNIADTFLRDFVASTGDRWRPPIFRLVSSKEDAIGADQPIQREKANGKKAGGDMTDSATIMHISIPGATWRDGSDVWKALCIECRENRVQNELELIRLLNQVESQYKATHSGPMPSKYRSAKSVLVKAFRHGISVYDKYGTPLGKSEVEKLCKEPVSH